MDLPVAVPFVPGLLAFRELLAASAAFAKLDTDVDLIMLDGQGIAHPRRMGIACHLGIYLDRPAIGCAKSRLTGSFTLPREEAGQHSDLRHRWPELTRLAHNLAAGKWPPAAAQAGLLE